MSKDFEEILLDVVWQHESVMEHRSPWDKVIPERRLPERADECADKEHLQEPHTHIRGHFKCSQLKEPQAKAKSVRRKQFVDTELRTMSIPCDISKQVSKQSVDSLRGTIARGKMSKSKLKFVQRIHARFIHTRILTGRADVRS